MQDFQSLADLAGGILLGDHVLPGASVGASDLRRIRGYPIPSPAAAPTPPFVKCPRCDSTNTKFCYYNNYNLSQPRHFCKSCRRYWTKGGVLRNVPVGGGCRKSKRSSSTNSSSFSSSKSSSRSSGPTSDDKSNKSRRQSPPSRPSIDSCGAITMAGKFDVYTSSTPFSQSIFLNPQTINSNSHQNSSFLFDSLGEIVAHHCAAPGIFQEGSGGDLSSLMDTPTSTATTTTSTAILGFGLVDSSPIRFPASQQNMSDVIQIMQPPVPSRRQESVVQDVDLQSIGVLAGAEAGVLATVDWAGQADAALFDLDCAVDPGSYWNHSHWGDADLSLYLP